MCESTYSTYLTYNKLHLRCENFDYLLPLLRDVPLNDQLIIILESVRRSIESKPYA